MNPSRVRPVFPRLRLAPWLLLAALAACGGGGDGGSSGGGDCPAPFRDDLSGMWLFEDTRSSEDCRASSVLDGSLFMVQDGDLLLFYGSISGTMEICGSRATNETDLTAERGGGIYTITRILITWSSPNQATGSTTWSWTDGVAPCSGTSTFTMTR